MLDLNTSIKLSNTTSDIQFSEVQKFRQIWIQMLLGLGFGLLLSAFVYQLIMQEQLFSFSSLTLVGVVLSGFTILVYRSHLDTKIDRRGIQYRFFPFQLTHRQISWEQVDEVYIREFDALIEYGGWGARYSNRGNAYIVSGKYGLQMEVADGRRVLISTQRPIELEKLILQLLYSYEVK